MGALPPPPGVTPNFVDPPSIQGGVVAVLIVAITVSTLCVMARMAAKLANRFANAGWDDCKCLHRTEYTLFPWMLWAISCLLALLIDTSFVAWVGR